MPAFAAAPLRRGTPGYVASLRWTPGGQAGHRTAGRPQTQVKCRPTAFTTLLSMTASFATSS